MAILAVASSTHRQVWNGGEPCGVDGATGARSSARCDSLLPGFRAGGGAAARHGFDPVVRRRVAARRQRFASAAEYLAEGLLTLGVDARPGPVPGEYCPGEFSVNARGATKLVGTAQRLTRHGYLLSVVVLVRDPEPVRAVLADAYPLLGMEWDPATVGSVADDVHPVTTSAARDALTGEQPWARSAERERPGG